MTVPREEAIGRLETTASDDTTLKGIFQIRILDGIRVVNSFCLGTSVEESIVD